MSVKRLLQEWGIRARFVRYRRAGTWALLSPDAGLEHGDVVTAVGLPEALDRLTARVGEASEEPVELDRGGLDMRRIFVSNVTRPTLSRCWSMR